MPYFLLYFIVNTINENIKIYRDDRKCSKTINIYFNSLCYVVNTDTITRTI